MDPAKLSEWLWTKRTTDPRELAELLCANFVIRWRENPVLDEEIELRGRRKWVYDEDNCGG